MSGSRALIKVDEFTDDVRTNRSCHDNLSSGKPENGRLELSLNVYRQFRALPQLTDSRES